MCASHVFVGMASQLPSASNAEPRARTQRRTLGLAQRRTLGLAQRRTLSLAQRRTLSLAQRRTLGLAQRRTLLAAAVGAAGVWALGPHAGDIGRGDVHAWVADRDGGWLYALDRDLLIVRAVPLVRPVRVVARPDGSAWVIEAPHGPDGAHLLGRVDPGGAFDVVTPLGPVRDIAATTDGGVAVLEGPWRAGAAVRLWAFDGDGAKRALAAPPGAVAVEGSGLHVGIAAAFGAAQVTDLRTPDAALFAARVGADPIDVASAPRGSGWWWLDAGPPARLMRLDERLLPRAEVVVDGRAPLKLIAEPQRDRCWVADGSGGDLHAYDGACNVVATVRLPINLAPEGGSALPRGGLLVVAPGAVARVDAGGLLVRSQGGFEFAVDVCVVPELALRARDPV